MLDTLTLKGCIVTIDATVCQTEIAQKILDRGEDYLLAVKDNQVPLAKSVREFFADGATAGFGKLAISSHKTSEKDHGRIESRPALWVTDLSWLDKPLRAHWPKLAGVGMIERQRDVNDTVSMERVFCIGSQGVTTAESFATSARSHRGIENSLYWVLDVTFRDDDCRVRKDHAPHNFDALRKFAIAQLCQDTVSQAQPALPAQNRRASSRLPRFMLGFRLRG